jgi:hypothetical protein
LRRVCSLQDYCSPNGTGWDGYGNGNRLYDADSGWKKIARLFAWEVGVNGVVVGDLVWFGLVSRFFLVFSLALAVLSFLVLFFYSTRRLWDWTGLFLYIYPHAFACSFFLLRDIR